MARKSSVLRCSNCGGSDIRFDEKSGKLRCEQCRSLIDGVMANGADDISMLKGKIISGGAKKIIDSKTMITMKCSACGAEVTVNTDEATSARCPWCRHVLSISDKLPNGAIPDLILPFKVTHEAAVEEVKAYIRRNRSLAKRKFVEDFNDDAVVGIYLPYMVVDMNVHAKMSGDGEIETRHYVVRHGRSEYTRYDANLYHVSREFDLEIDDLTVEASSDRLNQNVLTNTNNVVNAIMPFDTENAVEWDPRYVRGYSCERRDVDIEDVDKRVRLQVEDIMKYRMRNVIDQYNRGVRWDKMSLDRNGAKWKTAYLPVWLYSYLDEKPNGKSTLHYVAVNGRTRETVGSTPIEWSRVIFRAISVPLVMFIINMAMGTLARNGVGNKILTEIVVILSLIGLFWLPISIFNYVFSTRGARNKIARHVHEKDTRAVIKNVKCEDVIFTELRELEFNVMIGRNDNTIKGVLQMEDKFPKQLAKTMTLIMLAIFGMFALACAMSYNAASYSDKKGDTLFEEFIEGMKGNRSIRLR
ncbi:TFIIB-type zinc ribbon-containing protein [Candidatus Saccharibacteria bacterium]|nr:TFIIB-type zinc ribbon-containing protein [Candidatus Saccharibacteria bacterium]